MWFRIRQSARGVRHVAVHVRGPPTAGIGPGALPGINAGAPFRARFTPLNVAATLGMPALLTLAATVWLLWRRRRRPTDLAQWSALAAIGIDGLAQDIDHLRHVWVLIGPARCTSYLIAGTNLRCA